MTTPYDQVADKVLTDPRLATLLEELAADKIERHDFLKKVEMILEAHKAGLTVVMDPHEEFLGSA